MCHRKTDMKHKVWRSCKSFFLYHYWKWKLSSTFIYQSKLKAINFSHRNIWSYRCVNSLFVHDFRSRKKTDKHILTTVTTIYSLRSFWRMFFRVSPWHTLSQQHQIGKNHANILYKQEYFNLLNSVYHGNKHKINDGVHEYEATATR